MKNLKFILCSLLMLSFCLTVTAKENTHEKTKIEIVKFTNVQDFAPAAVVNFEINYFWQHNHFMVVQNSKTFVPPFAIMPDVGWYFNTFVSHYSIYKNKLNNNYIPDKRQELHKTGTTINRLNC